MVFYQAALDAGLDARYSRHAINYELEPASRSTYNYQLRRSLWHGNTEAVTNLRAGRASRSRLVLRAGRRAVAAIGRPVQRLLNRQPPQLRYTVALLVQSVGMVLGAVGLKLNHI